MEFSSIEPRLSSYLHAKACKYGIPLAGTFELTPRCNFDCKMCYVHLSAEEQQRRGRELTADEWLETAESARKQGMLFLLLTGGEPLIRNDFKYLLTELKKMGLLVSVNSNGSMINEDLLEFFRREPPFRINVTLYGGSNETYESLCGQRAFDRVTSNIRALKNIGVDVKMNVSLTQYNASDLEKIHTLAHELGTPMQVATYMFPPIRKNEELIGSNDRFSPCQAAKYSVFWDKLRLDPDIFEQRAAAIKNGLSLPKEDTCEGTPGEGISCRAGRSTFWINWQGDMTPCGMMTAPKFSVTELGFDTAWRLTKEATEAIRMPSECSACPSKNVCHVCAAMCLAETGHFDKKPQYLCEMTQQTIKLTLEEANL